MSEQKKYLIDTKWWADTLAFMKQNKELNERLFQAMLVIQDVNTDRKKWREYAKKWEQHAKSLEVQLENASKPPRGEAFFKKQKTPTTQIQAQTGGRFPTATEAGILNKVAEEAAKKAIEDKWEEISNFNFSGDLPQVQSILKQYSNDMTDKDTEYMDENLLEKKTEP